MKVRLTRDLTLPLATTGRVFWVQIVSQERDGTPIYWVDYYGNVLAFPGDACEVVEE